MSTVATLVVLLVAGGVLGWLLRDLFGGGRRGGRKCPVCGSGNTRLRAGQRTCSICGAEFRPHDVPHLHEPTLGHVSLVLLGFVAMLPAMEASSRRATK